MGVMSRPENDLISSTLTKSSEDVAFILEALANERRLLLLSAVFERAQTFRDLQAVAKLGKTALAHHLGVLVQAGLLRHARKGHYELSADGAEFLRGLTAAYTSSRKRRELEAARRADYILKTHTKEKGKRMKKFEVDIVKLEPMHVASVRAVSTTPERDAWSRMRAWAEPRGLLEDTEEHPVFGFNSPDPSPGQREYGYEFWIRVDPGTRPSGDVDIKEFDGGLYAVTTCKLKEELESEFFQKEGYLESWKNIVDWVKTSKYTMGKHQCLEKSHDPGASEDELVLDLYCPIEEV
jgi:DNA gyrase inhibitor GyrI/DNA-binding transcriptional ArsR family regulator